MLDERCILVLQSGEDGMFMMRPLLLYKCFPILKTDSKYVVVKQPPLNLGPRDSEVTVKIREQL